MKLSSILAADRVLVDVEADDKWQLIERLVGFLAERVPPGWPSAAELLEVVRRREEQMTTGLEQGIAVPHGMIGHPVATHGVLAVCPRGLDFESMDGNPARFVLLLVFSNDEDGRALHLEVLSQALKTFTREDLREGLLQAEDAAAAWRLLLAVESDD